MSAHVTGGGRRALGLVSAAGGGRGGPGRRDGSGRDPGGAAGSREAAALRPTPERGALGPAELRRLWRALPSRPGRRLSRLEVVGGDGARRRWLRRGGEAAVGPGGAGDSRGGAGSGVVRAAAGTGRGWGPGPGGGGRCGVPVRAGSGMGGTCDAAVMGCLVQAPERPREKG